MERIKHLPWAISLVQRMQCKGDEASLRNTCSRGPGQSAHFRSVPLLKIKQRQWLKTTCCKLHNTYFTVWLKKTLEKHQFTISGRSGLVLCSSRTRLRAGLFGVGLGCCKKRESTFCGIFIQLVKLIHKQENWFIFLMDPTNIRFTTTKKRVCVFIDESVLFFPWCSCKKLLIYWGSFTHTLNQSSVLDQRAEERSGDLVNAFWRNPLFASWKWALQNDNFNPPLLTIEQQEQIRRLSSWKTYERIVKNI